MFPTEETVPTPPEGSESVEDALRKITSGWLSKIELAKQSKKHFNDIGDQCTAFFQAAVSFMWEPDFRRKFLGTNVSPNFHVTLNKAFELVSIYGPTLYWQNPQRMLQPRKHIDLIPEMFGANPALQTMLQQQMQQIEQQMQQSQQMAQPQGQGQPPNPQAQAIMQQLQQQQQQLQAQISKQQEAEQRFNVAMADQQSDFNKRGMRSRLLEQWLNYTPIEQPGGGLETHAMRAITESLVKGRGCLMPQAYNMPGSKTKLTGCFYKSVDDLFLDPDATGLGPNECWWMAVKHTQPVWFVERKFGLKGKLSKAATYERRSSFGERNSADLGENDRAQGKTQDTITYYEIWSKAGAGHRLSGLKNEYKAAFEKVGDYVRIVVAKGVPYPLNAPPQKVHSATTEELKQIFAWEYPFWKDGRWPVVCLDYWHRVPDKDPQSSAWPIAPLEPGLGELITLNVMIAHIVNRTWSSSRDFIAVLQSAHKDVEKWLKKGQDMTIFPVKEIYGDINKVVQWIQQPQMNSDMWKAVETLIGLFEKRVGLTELLYGMSAQQSRSAADVETKRAQMNIRPDHMAKQVEHWMEQCARQEKMVARWSIEAKDVNEVLGKYEAQAWNQLISKAPVEETVREVECTVAAGSVRKPNKERDANNMAQVMQVIMPELSAHANTTGDTGPLNNMISKWGDSIDQDMGEFQMGPRTPMEGSPEEQQAQQQQIEMQQQMLQLELQILQAKAQGEQQKMASSAELERAKLQSMQIKAQMDMAKAQTAQQQAEAKARLDQAKIGLAQLQSEIRRDEAQLIGETREDQHKLEMLIRNEQRQQQQADNENKIRLEQLKQAHEMRLDQERHESEMLQAFQKHGFDVESQGMKSDIDHMTEIEKSRRQSLIDAQKMFLNSQQGINNGSPNNRQDS